MAETSGGLCTLCRYSPDVYRSLVTTTMITGKDNKCGKARVYERQNSLYNWHVVGHQDDKQTAIGKMIESDFAGERDPFRRCISMVPTIEGIYAQDRKILGTGARVA